MRLLVTPGIAEAAVRAVTDRKPGLLPRFAADVVNEFCSQGLAKPLLRVLSEFRTLGVPLAVVARARKDEGVTVSPRRDEVQVVLHPERFLDLEALERYVRHEFMHVSDMLDPAFAYPETPEGGEYPDAVRARYALLWALLCDARTIRAGRAPLRDRDEWKRHFDDAFAAFDGRSKAFDALWDSPRPSHPELWHLSIEPSRVMQRFGGLAAPGPRSPGQLCPLCRFPTFDWRDAPAEALEAIREDFPRWEPPQGLCGRCAEVYEVRVGLWR